MTDTIKVSDVEAYALEELARAEKSTDKLSRDMRCEWAYGVALMLRKFGHREAADHVEAKRREVFSWNEYVDAASE